MPVWFVLKLVLRKRSSLTLLYRRSHDDQQLGNSEATPIFRRKFAS